MSFFHCDEPLEFRFDVMFHWWDNVQAKLPRLPVPCLAETDVEAAAVVAKKNAWAGQLEPAC